MVMRSISVGKEQHGGPQPGRYSRPHRQFGVRTRAGISRCSENKRGSSISNGKESVMTYEMKPLSCNPAQLKGLSEKMIVSHYENNYGGAVKRLNAITAQLESLDFATASVFMINGLKREELIASNSMILHELYF